LSFVNLILAQIFLRGESAGLIRLWSNCIQGSPQVRFPDFTNSDIP